MEIDKIKKLLRFFFFYETEYLFFIKKGKLTGVIKKSIIEENLSDLDRLKEINDEPEKIILEITDLEEALEIYEKYAVKQEEKLVFPVVNSEFELTGLWGRKEIIQSWENIPSIKKWNPAEDEKKQPIKIKIEKKTEETKNDKRAATTESYTKLENEYKKKIYWSNLLINAVETLPLPMLALDTSGVELFFNKEWETNRKGVFKLRTLELIKNAKNIIGEMAIKSELKLSEILKIDTLEKNKTVFMRCIQKAGILENENVKAIGYLFWIEESKDAAFEEKKQIKPFIKENDKKESYLGRTLPEILAEKERKALKWAYDEAGGNLSNAAMLLGIPRQTFSYRYKKLFN
ncbi:MAG: hypothetical protein OEZ13_02755 [Spirochaetia bacterium]|nr:hypothetical protein [Spirochaetia bacterium]